MGTEEQTEEQGRQLEQMRSNCPSQYTRSGAHGSQERDRVKQLLSGSTAEKAEIGPQSHTELPLGARKPSSEGFLNECSIGRSLEGVSNEAPQNEHPLGAALDQEKCLDASTNVGKGESMGLFGGMGQRQGSVSGAASGTYAAGHKIPIVGSAVEEYDALPTNVVRQAHGFESMVEPVTSSSQAFFAQRHQRNADAEMALEEAGRCCTDPKRSNHGKSPLYFLPLLVGSRHPLIRLHSNPFPLFSLFNFRQLDETLSVFTSYMISRMVWAKNTGGVHEIYVVLCHFLSARVTMLRS